MDKLLCLVGPTGVGKSEIALRLAVALNGEIVNADSRQVYKYLDIGTAKPSIQDRNKVKHHLLDVAEPDSVFSLALYRQQALAAFREIAGRGKLPILVGGSGQYIWSLLEGWEIPPVAPDEQMRQSLEEEATTEAGKNSLRQELKRLDPDMYDRIDLHNMRRVIRALETCRQGMQFSKLRQKMPSEWEGLVVGLTRPRTELYQRVDHRVEKMLLDGLLAETQDLLARYPHKHSVLATIGYKQLTAYIRGTTTLQQAVQTIKFETHRYIRQQYTWFKPTDPRIQWFTLGQTTDQNVVEEIIALTQQFISESKKEK